jgi:ATP-dependent RNA helicase DeaD
MPFPLIHPALNAALDARGYAEPTAVQSACLEPGTSERDLLVSAQTGSGKTIAYGLALAPTILGDLPQLPATKKPLVLVIAPTRELALQVHAELTWLYAQAGARIVSCVGGMDARGERRLLDAGCRTISTAAISTSPSARPWCSMKPTRCSISASRTSWILS